MTPVRTGDFGPDCPGQGMTPILFAKKKWGHARVRHDQNSFREKNGGHAPVGVTPILFEKKIGVMRRKLESRKYSGITPVRTGDFGPDCTGQGMTPILFAQQKWGHARVRRDPNSFREKKVWPTIGLN